MWTKSLGRNDVTKMLPGCWVLFKMAATKSNLDFFGDEFHKENLHFRGWNFGEWLNLLQGFYQRWQKYTFFGLIFIPNRTFLVRFGGISSMVRVLARRSRAKISMARPNEPDMPPKRMKKVRLGIYRTQIRGGFRKLSKRGPNSPLPPYSPNENFTFQDMQHTKLWAYSWCTVKQR